MWAHGKISSPSVFGKSEPRVPDLLFGDSGKKYFGTDKHSEEQAKKTIENDLINLSIKVQTKLCRHRTPLSIV